MDLLEAIDLPSLCVDTSPESGRAQVKHGTELESVSSSRVRLHLLVCVRPEQVTRTDDLTALQQTILPDTSGKAPLLMKSARMIRLRTYCLAI